MSSIKYENLVRNIEKLNNAAVAFSGGVDSTFLLKVVHDVLGGDVIAVTARSLSFPKRELDAACGFTAANGIKHVIVDSEELNIEGFSSNPPNRCYLCKTELFTKIKAVAQQNNIENILEGSNADDVCDYRPGLKAVSEMGILSPLRQAGITKEEIRQLSKNMGLPTWDKQAFACLSSRFPYGEDITPERLRMIDAAEQFLLDLGFHQVRVRYHGNLARIETDGAGFRTISDQQCREKIYTEFRSIGFTYIALDLKGYRVGSMNETLNL